MSLRFNMIRDRTTHLLGEDHGATFSPCRLWRYRLWRIWDHALPRVCFCLMNPSTADEVKNDPTIAAQYRRVMKWNAIRRNGRTYGGIEVVNVFAWRETDSSKLLALRAAGIDLVGPDNDFHIAAAARAADLVVCGWGQPGSIGGRGAEVMTLLRGTGTALAALGINVDGTPRHPLYIGHDADLVGL